MDGDAISVKFDLDARVSFNDSIAAGLRIGYQTDFEDMEVEGSEMSLGGFMIGVGIFRIL